MPEINSHKKNNTVVEFEPRAGLGRKKIALALSGCAGRAVAYIGMLEVFAENDIPVDYIAACSSGALVACAYGSGRLKELKEKAFNLSSKDIPALFELSLKSGLLSLDRLDQVFAEFLSAENLEDLNIPIAIVASDIIEGKEVVFRMGNILRAIKASCSMPGIFEPVVWGGKVLVDGGLLSIAPVEAARDFGSDLVIGIDMAESRNLFGQTLYLKSTYNYLMRPFARFGSFQKNIKKMMFGDANVKIVEHATINEVKTPSLLNVLGKAMDLAIEERRKTEFFNCDLMIRPEITGYGKLTNSDFEVLYKEGRRFALEYLPKIKELLV